MSEHKIPIPAMLYNAAVGGHVTNSQQIIDENENKEQSKINAEVKQILGQGGSVDIRITNAVNIEKTRAEKVEASLDDRVDTIEEAVGTGGSVDSRISAAVASETSRAQTAEEQLRQIYEALSQSQPIPVTELPATGEAGKIYRLAGTTSYADYMYAEGALNTPIKMAEYDNAIDDEPTAGSENLVKSKGINTKIKKEIENTIGSFPDLINKNTNIGFISTNGETIISSMTNFRYSDFIPVEGVKEYKLQIYGIKTSSQITFFSDLGNTVVETNIADSNGKWDVTIPVPSGAKYVRFCIISQDDPAITFSQYIYMVFHIAPKITELGKIIKSQTAITNDDSINKIIKELYLIPNQIISYGPLHRIVLIKAKSNGTKYVNSIRLFFGYSDNDLKDFNILYKEYVQQEEALRSLRKMNISKNGAIIVDWENIDDIVDLYFQNKNIYNYFDLSNSLRLSSFILKNGLTDNISTSVINNNCMESLFSKNGLYIYLNKWFSNKNEVSIFGDGLKKTLEQDYVVFPNKKCIKLVKDVENVNIDLKGKCQKTEVNISFNGLTKSNTDNIITGIDANTNFDINYFYHSFSIQGNTNLAEITVSPTNANEKVLHLLANSTTEGLKENYARVQLNYGSASLRGGDYEQTVDIFLPTELSILKDYPNRISWFTIEEFWVDAQTFRITINISKEQGTNKPLYLNVTTQDMKGGQQPAIIDIIGDNFELPLGSWFTLRTKITPGDENTGKLEVYATYNNNVYEICNQIGRTFGTNYLADNAFANYLLFENPCKIYVDGNIINYLVENSEKAEVYFKNLNIVSFANISV